MKSSGIFLFIQFFFITLAAAQTVTVRQLYNEQRQNPAGFASKYKGKTITVSGKIRSISPGSDYFRDPHRIHLTATGYENFVVCRIPYEDKATLGRLKAGETITVTGTADPGVTDAIFLDNCRFGNAAPVIETVNKAPAKLPLGKYHVYQNNGAGFSYQYALNLTSYRSYTLSKQTGSFSYDAGTNLLKFTGGPLKGFAGIYRAINTSNEKDPPTILLDPTGKTPLISGSHTGYQFAYFQNN